MRCGRTFGSCPAWVGTSGHRGSAFEVAFNEAHILAITQAICFYRKQKQIDGPLFLGMDTHALSEPAFATALEVLAANDVDVMIDRDRGYTPTPVVSHAILHHNRDKKTTGGRYRDYSVAQPAGRRRLEVQPAAWRSRRHSCHSLDRGRGQPPSGRRFARGQAGFL